MAWLRIRLPVNREQVAAVEAAFGAAGAQALIEQRTAGQELLEPAPGATPLWQGVEVEALFGLDEDLSGQLVRLRKELLPDWRASLKVDFLEEDDWQNRFRAHGVAACFGNRLWVLPRFDKRTIAENEVALYLDPGLAFGTGGHPTTALCLDWLAHSADAFEGRRVMDFGCGSGILALAAVLLGASSVTAVDHDPQALLATGDNARNNGIDGTNLSIELAASLPESAPFDLVVANILANPLIELAPQLSSLLVKGGRLALTGILPEQADSVRRAYPEVNFAPPIEREGWVLLTGQKLDNV